MDGHKKLTTKKITKININKVLICTLFVFLRMYNNSTFSEHGFDTILLILFYNVIKTIQV